MKGVDVGAGRFPAQVECAQHGGYAGEGVADVPVLVAQVERQAIAPLGIFVKRARKRGFEAAFLRVPAHEGCDVGGRAADVGVLGIDRLIANAAEDREQRDPDISAPTVALLKIQDDVELVVRFGSQLEAGLAENFETFNADATGLKIGEPQFACRRQRQGAIEQGGLDAQRIVGADGLDLRLADAIPVFEGGFEITLQPVNGSQELVCVGIRGIETQGAPQPTGGAGIMLLFEGDAGKFDGKTLVAWRRPAAGEKSLARVVEPAKLCQGAPVVVVEVGVGRRRAFDFSDDFFPALVGVELSDPGGEIVS